MPQFVKSTTSALIISKIAGYRSNSKPIVFSHISNEQLKIEIKKVLFMTTLKYETHRDIFDKRWAESIRLKTIKHC
jgi:hypothetical protein